MVTKVEKVLYQAHATSTGGRDGSTRTSDGLLDIKLAVPKEMGGAGGGVNPEQLFAAGYSACFIGAMKFVAGAQKMAMPADAGDRRHRGHWPDSGAASASRCRWWCICRAWTARWPRR